MPELTIKRVPFTSQATARLANLRSRIIIKENNILCRMGFCLSLEEHGTPMLPETLDGSPIDRFTLLGEHDKAFIALLMTWMHKNGYENISSKDLTQCFIAHMNRGVEIISSRIKSMSDFAQLIPETLR